MATAKRNALTPKQIRFNTFQSVLNPVLIGIGTDFENWILRGRTSDQRNQTEKVAWLSTWGGGPDKNEFKAEAVAALDALVKDYRDAGWKVEFTKTVNDGRLDFRIVLSDD